MNKVFSAITYGLLFTSISFAQTEMTDLSTSDKESALKYLQDKAFKTTSYEVLEYDDKGTELLKSEGASTNTWHVTVRERQVNLLLKHKNEVIESYEIEKYDISLDGVLSFSAKNENVNIWFYEKHILVETRDYEIETNEEYPAHRLSWFFFN